MRDKNGFLLAEETLKMVIALVCIGFLVYFLTSLYFSNINDQKFKEAESDIERISQVINNIQIDSEIIPGLKASGWTIFSFVGDKKPNSCSGENCLCICDEVFVDTLFGIIESRQLNECSNNGVCLVVGDLNYFENIEIKKAGGTNIEINKLNGVQIIKK